MNSAILTILMLVVSNVFMTLAWYGHLRLGYAGNGGPFSLVQLKVMQEAITLVVFTVVATFVFQGQSIRWNHIVAFLLLVGAVYFSFLDTSK